MWVVLVRRSCREPYLLSCVDWSTEWRWLGRRAFVAAMLVFLPMLATSR